MSASNPSRRKKGKKSAGVMDELLEYITQAIDEADEEAAAERVAELREDHPDATSEDLVEMLIKHKCLRTGAVGAVTSGASMIPGLGSVVSLTFGVAADIGITFTMQAELVLEIAAVYERELDPTEKRNVVMLVTGISVGANKMLGQAGTKIAQKTTERLAQKSVAKAIPVFGVAASAGTNILTTYVVGQRANAYFSLGPEAVGDWGESVRAVSGLDERKLIGWLTETTEHSWTLVKDRAHDAAGSVIVAGKSAGAFMVVSADRAKQAAAAAGRSVTEGASATAGAAVDLGKRTGASIVAGAEKTGEAMSSAGQSVAAKTGAAAGKVADTGRATLEGVTAGASKASEAVTDVGKSVAEGADAAKKRFSKTFGRFKRDKAQTEPEAGTEDEARPIC